MSDQVLYRKYRSQTFDAVIGQDHIVKTLVAQIAADQLAHAYLFTGPRGTGKTSVARLLARAANCTGNPKPCGTCQTCVAALNQGLDIIEIDAASNRSIDSIRELRDKIALAPNIGRYKVYIVDEVHMLTTEAFNALLKTLEEPPAHALFILATTEAHKVPDTIISRTQRFGFRPIGHAHLTSHLASIAQAENIQIEPAALDVLAATSGGGFRDAISLLDQIRPAASDKPFTADDVEQLLGLAPHTQIAKLANAISTNQPAEALAVCQQIAQTGTSGAQTVTQLLEHFRTILGQAVSGQKSSPDSPGVSPRRAADVVTALLGISKSPWPELALEAVIVQLTTEPVVTKSRKPAETPSAAQDPAPATVATPTPDPAPSAGQTEKPDGGVPAASLWPKVLVAVKSKNNSLGALLQMYPADFAAGEVVIKPRFNFHRDLFMKPINRNVIEATATKVYGEPIRISARTVEEPGTKRRKATPDPNAELVSSALEILGGEVVD